MALRLINNPEWNKCASAVSSAPELFGSSRFLGISRFFGSFGLVGLSRALIKRWPVGARGEFDWIPVVAIASGNATELHLTTGHYALIILAGRTNKNELLWQLSFLAVFGIRRTIALLYQALSGRGTAGIAERIGIQWGEQVDWSA